MNKNTNRTFKYWDVIDILTNVYDNHDLAKGWEEIILSSDYVDHDDVDKIAEMAFDRFVDEYLSGYESPSIEGQYEKRKAYYANQN